MRVRAFGPGGGALRLVTRQGAPVTQARLDALVAFGLACVLALWLTPLAAGSRPASGWSTAAARTGACTPSPIPFGGGIAMFVAVAVPVLLLQPSLGGRAHAILLGACVCAAVGLLDDRFEIHPVAKLAGELAAAAIPVAAGRRSTTSRCRCCTRSTWARCSTR